MKGWRWDGNKYQGRIFAVKGRKVGSATQRRHRSYAPSVSGRLMLACCCCCCLLLLLLLLLCHAVRSCLLACSRSLWPSPHVTRDGKVTIHHDDWMPSLENQAWHVPALCNRLWCDQCEWPFLLVIRMQPPTSSCTKFSSFARYLATTLLSSFRRPLHCSCWKEYAAYNQSEIPKAFSEMVEVLNYRAGRIQ